MLESRQKVPERRAYIIGGNRLLAEADIMLLSPPDDGMIGCLVLIGSNLFTLYHNLF